MYDVENPVKRCLSRWTQTTTTVKVNKCASVLILIGLMIFLGTFIFLICALVQSYNKPSDLEIKPNQIISNQTIVNNIGRNETSVIQPVCNSSNCIRAASYLLESMDFEADPCEDFYQFTCGKWDNYQIRLDSFSSWSWFSIITKRVEHAIEVFLKSKPKANESKAISQSRIMYKSCMNAVTIHQIESGQKHIRNVLEKSCFPYIYKAHNKCNFDWNATWEEMSEYSGPTRNDFDLDSQAFINKVEHYIAFTYRTNNHSNIIAMIKNTTNELIKIEGTDIERLTQMNEIDPEGLQTFIWWTLIDLLVATVRFDYNYDYETGKYISISRSKYCAQNVNDHMGMFLSDAITIPNFLNTTRPNLLESTENIRSIFNDLVENSDWMDEETKRKVIEKSLAMRINVGFSEFLLNKTIVDELLKDLNMSENSLLENENAMFEISENVASMAMPNMNSTEINAYYYPRLNSLMVTMGILQFPLYGLGIEALNYGFGISTFGHEFSHGFDNMGRLFDKNGEENDEWTNETIKEYEKRTNCLVDQYNKFNLSEIDSTVAAGVNGSNTLGENIADNVGLLLAYKAYEMFVAKNGEEEMLPAFEQFTHEQLFFIGYGNSYCKSASARGLKFLNDDVHALSKFRVNGVVSNMEEFRAAFKCKADSKMVSKNPCRIW